MDDMKLLIAGLAKHLGRLPTEEEVTTFIFGDEQKRLEILNSEVNSAAIPAPTDSS